MISVKSLINALQTITYGGVLSSLYALDGSPASVERARDRAALDVLFQAEKIDGAIHFAASSQVGESMSDPLRW